MSQNCPYCREAIAGASQHACPTCNTPHHLDCWNENGGCTVFGCSSAPPDEPKLALAKSSASPLLPPPVPAVGSAFSPSSQRSVYPGGHFVTEFLRDRRILVRNLLFVGFMAMPVGALAGALLGLGLGFIFAIFGGGVGSIFRFPMMGMCWGQALGVVSGVILATILGDSFVALSRRKALTFVRFVFEGVDIGSPANKTETPPNTPL